MKDIVYIITNQCFVIQEFNLYNSEIAFMSVEMSSESFDEILIDIV